MIFTRESDGTVDLTTASTFANGEIADFSERYTWNPATATWTWHARYVQHPEMQQDGTAGPWIGKMWLFLGAETVGSPPDGQSSAGPEYGIHVGQSDIRMAYIRIDDNTFERVFEAPDKMGWSPVSDSRCVRANPN